MDDNKGVMMETNRNRRQHAPYLAPQWKQSDENSVRLTTSEEPLQHYCWLSSVSPQCTAYCGCPGNDTGVFLSVTKLKVRLSHADVSKGSVKATGLSKSFLLSECEQAWEHKAASTSWIQLETRQHKTGLIVLKRTYDIFKPVPCI